MMIEKFLNYLKFEHNRSELTVKGYGEDLQAFETYFENLDNQLSWNSVDSDIIRDWMESMMDKGNNATSINRRLSALRSFYRFALSHKLVTKDPSHRIKGPKKNKPLPQFLKEGEINRILSPDMWEDNYDDACARTIIMTFYETGIRLSELVGMDDTSVNFVTKEIKVTGKRNKQRIIPFGDELENTIRHYMEMRDSQIQKQSTALFLSDVGLRLDSVKVRNIVKKNLSKVCTLKERTPHVLRHTFATVMLNHNAGLESLKKLLGHASLSTTEIYTHTTFEQLKKVYNDAHPRA
nr:tyrosine-type recombinase/integrase [Prevotella sp.]